MRYTSIPLALALSFLTVVPAVAARDAALETKLRAAAAAYGGKVAFYAAASDGRTAELNADTPVPTASVIKLTVLFEALKEIQAGRVSLHDTLTMTPQDPVPGSGVLRLFDAPLKITLKDALTMMVTVSDNTATNLVIDRLGIQNIDNRIQWLGLHDTWLYKKVFKPAPPGVPADQPTFGLGKTTAREMASVIQRIATCALNAPGDTTPPSASDRALCDTAVEMLKNQTDRDGIPRYLGEDVANKTGSLDEVRNDVGVVYAKNGPIVISAFTYDNADKSWTPDNRGTLLIARLAKIVDDAWK
ncbi:MAG TPA: serine hydrolase [Candidatus Baltobacteraceae bacterium]|nr:serine hydrolase [Candidatus Baltobacteraceae bacterium]